MTAWHGFLRSPVWWLMLIVSAAVAAFTSAPLPLLLATITVAWLAYSAWRYLR